MSRIEYNIRDKVLSEGELFRSFSFTGQGKIIKKYAKKENVKPLLMGYNKGS